VCCFTAQLQRLREAREALQRLRAAKSVVIQSWFRRYCAQKVLAYLRWQRDDAIARRVEVEILAALKMQALWRVRGAGQTEHTA
jgi:hypothetical protein